MRVLEEDMCTIDTYMEHLDAVTTDDILRVAKECFHINCINISLVGKIDTNKFKNYVGLLGQAYVKK